MEDVEHNLDDIVVPYPHEKIKKIIGGNKIHVNVPTTPLENVSFHSDESVINWNFVYYRRIAPGKDI